MSYPLSAQDVDEQSRHYRDDAAAALYIVAEGSKLAAAHSKLCRALEKQATKLEEFYNTPYSDEHAKLIATTTESLAFVEAQLERWHLLIYPNQR